MCSAVNQRVIILTVRDNPSQTMLNKHSERKSYSTFRLSHKSVTRSSVGTLPSNVSKPQRNSRQSCTPHKNDCRFERDSLFSPEKQNDGDRQISIKPCQIHGKPLDAFCKNCYRLLCVHCIIDFHHNGHTLEKPRSAFLREKQKLTAIRLGVFEAGKALDLSFEKIDLHLFEQQSGLKSRLKRVGESFERVIESLTRNFNEFKEQIRYV